MAMDTWNHLIQLKVKLINHVQSITYVYKEVKGDVYVHYKDTDGNTIKDDVTDEKINQLIKITIQ